MSEGESFLSRWSRRKRAIGATPALPVAPPVAAPGPPEPAAPPDAAEEPAFDPASLPPVESLTAESDFAAFLREEVPAALRQAALRRAWSLDPAIRDFVGPADYAWDYNAPGGVPGFSLELLGDVDRLIAQAVGLGPGPSEAPATAAAEVAAPPTGTPPAEQEHARSEPPPAVEALDEPPPETLPAPEAAPVAELPPARRRHGGALPS